jgi:outer membrane protein assembly factor BamA
MLCFFSYSWSLVIHKIKVSGNTFTSRDLILGVASELYEGLEIAEKDLERVASRIEKRLKNTGWFYSVNVYVVPTSAGDGYRNVIIEVVEGFLWRFGGGNAYAMFGKENIGGKGRKLLVYLGYNRQGVKWGWEEILPRFSVGGRLGNFDDAYYTEDGSRYSLQKIGGDVQFSYLFSWDSRLGVHAGYEAVFEENYHFLFPEAGIGAFYLFDSRDDIFSARKGLYGKIGIEWLYLTNSIWQYDGRVFLPLFGGMRLTFRGLVEIGENLPIQKACHLFGINGVRSFGRDHRMGEIKVLGSGELRNTFLRTVVFGFLNVVFEGVVFCDVGRCEMMDKMNQIFSLEEIPFGWGGGIRFYFMEPVYVPLRFEVGFNEKFQPQFFFAVEEPF